MILVRNDLIKHAFKEYCNLNLQTQIDIAQKINTKMCILDVLFPLVWINVIKSQISQNLQSDQCIKIFLNVFACSFLPIKYQNDRQSNGNSLESNITEYGHVTVN